jgi:hypothetical protein
MTWHLARHARSVYTVSASTGAVLSQLALPRGVVLPTLELAPATGALYGAAVENSHTRLVHVTSAGVTTVVDLGTDLLVSPGISDFGEKSNVFVTVAKAAKGAELITVDVVGAAPPPHRARARPPARPT